MVRTTETKTKSEIILCYYGDANRYTLFFINNTFRSNEFLLFENYSLSSSKLSSKNNKRYSKKYTKNKCVCFNEVIWLMAMKMRLKMKNRSNIYDINGPRPGHGHKYTKYKM